MKIHLQIAEGILTPSASEYRSENLESFEAVQRYAEGAYDIPISDNSAQVILAACISWLEYSGSEGQNEYHHRVKKPLLELIESERISSTEARVGSWYLTEKPDSDNPGQLMVSFRNHSDYFQSTQSGILSVHDLPGGAVPGGATMTLSAAIDLVKTW